MDNNNRRIIQMLDTLPKFETYSQYSSSLEKVFHDNSFKNLLKSLREQKKPKIYSYFNVELTKPETNSIFQSYGLDNKKEESKTNLFKEEDNEFKTNEREKDNFLTKKESWKFMNLKSKKIRFNPELDPFRYNPNYNSIFKNTPCVRITKPFNETSPSYKYKNRNNNIKKQIESPFLTEIGDKAMVSNKKIKDFHLKNLDDLQKINTKIKLKKEDNEDKNNHSLRFDKYVDRKIVKTEINPNVSYIEPYDYQKAKNNSIDFSKMHSRYDNDTYFLHGNNLNGPTIGYYNPNYEYLEKNVRNISLGNERKAKSKKYLLKKIWTGYGVRVDYQLIDNSKLRNISNEYNL
jgi:hypothetical protein